MFKNVLLKKILKNTVFEVASVVNRFLPKDDKYILLYSANMGIRHNLRPLKQYMVTNEYNKSHKIICGIENLTYAEPYEENVKYVGKLKSIFYFLKVKYVFYTTGQIPIKPSKAQKVFQLLHGTTFKAPGKMSKINNGDEFYFTACMATSEIYKDVYSKAFGCPKKNIVINSEPVTDIFFKNHERYALGNFDKIILWTPTFRQSDYLGYSDSVQEDLIPLFKEDDYEKLNEELSKYNYKLIVKIHGGQDLKKYSRACYSHLELLSNDDFARKGYELYCLLSQIDLLIADYSSLFLQFLLLNKPILFVVPDIEDYSSKRGFAFENPLDYMPGEKIKSQKEFYDFLNKYSKGIDDYEKEREKVKKMIHQYSDGLSCQRLMEMSGITK